MLPTSPQAGAGAVGGGGGEEEFGEATEFISWAAKGAADLILPDLPEIEENSDDDKDTDDDDGDGES